MQPALSQECFAFVFRWEYILPLQKGAYYAQHTSSPMTIGHTDWCYGFGAGDELGILTKTEDGDFVIGANLYYDKVEYVSLPSFTSGSPLTTAEIAENNLGWERKKDRKDDLRRNLGSYLLPGDGTWPSQS